VLGRVARHAVEADDVVDEVLARAWSDFDFRPRELSLDAWLNGIYTEVVGDLLGAKPEQVPFADELDPGQLKDEIGDPLASHHEPFWPYADSEMLGEVVPDPVASAEPTAAIDIEEEST
jgi:DNA-directed RNA polymerase specialized sigma24 family protein